MFSLSAAAPSDAADIGSNAEEMSPPQLASSAFRARVIEQQTLHRDKVCLSFSVYDLPFSKIRIGTPSHVKIISYLRLLFLKGAKVPSHRLLSAPAPFARHGRLGINAAALPFDD